MLITLSANFRVGFEEILTSFPIFDTFGPGRKKEEVTLEL